MKRSDSISGHPLEKFRADLKRFGVSSIRTAAHGSNKAVKLSGVVTALKLKNTKKGDRYASFLLEDFSGTVEALVRPDTYQEVEVVLIAEYRARDRAA